MANIRDKVFVNLQPWRMLGFQKFEDGTTLIGRVPHVAPEAWFHMIFAPLRQEDLESVKSRLGTFGNFPFLSTFEQFNGFNLFSSNCFLFGLRTSYKRDGSVFQPWDIITHHFEARAKGLPEELLLIGGSKAIEGGVAFAQAPDGQVVALEKGNNWIETYRWASAECFILDEVHRLNVLFDTAGKEIDKEALSSFGLKPSVIN
jgi:hypothetical protein